MAKVNKLKQGLGTLRKKPIIAEQKSEEIISVVHSKEPEEVKTKKRGRKKVNHEETIRYTIDIPKSTYKRIRHRVVDEGSSMKAFILKIIEKELK